MKVTIKIFDNKTEYQGVGEPNRMVDKQSIGEAIKYCKSQIKKTEGFIAFKIETTTGELKHKLHNQ